MSVYNYRRIPTMTPPHPPPEREGPPLAGAGKMHLAAKLLPEHNSEMDVR